MGSGVGELRSGGGGARERGVPMSVYLAPDGRLEWDLRPQRIAEALKEGGSLWVDVDSTDRAQHALLEKVFGFHHLAIEDTLSPRTRVKLEEYGPYLFFVIRAVQFDQSTEDPYDIDTQNVYCFLGKQMFVTVHGAPVKAIEEVRHRLERGPELLNRGIEMVAHGVVDITVDEFLPLVDRVDDFVDELEQRLFVRFDEGAVREIFAVKRLVVQLRRHLGPLREVLNVLTNRPHACVNPQAQVYFRDVYDHTIRVVESLESVRDLVATVLDTYLTQMSNRMNKVMKSLSVVATISLPMVVIGGIFGMNFSALPLTHSPLGFWWALGIMVAAAAGIWWFLKRQDWV
ncbi:MAG TPA: magnesium/cobalt transporter CorA [Gemmatimonadales bacterium]|nr:magnesium/cobalt transporter CorA [Gemmatimonadales bacterium]